MEEEYTKIFSQRLDLSFFFISLDLSFRDWINDFFMAQFFLLIGIDLKKELVDGHLATSLDRLFPLVAAIMGVVTPILIYIAINYNTGIRGWAIPSATDIAFTIGALSIFGRAFPPSLKVFVTALAVIDDLIAIVIIALFYTSMLHFGYVACGCVCVIFLYMMNKCGVTKISSYLIVGIVMWYCFLRSGIHPTISGVVLGSLMPISTKKVADVSRSFRRRLEIISSYCLMPLFAFANGGILLSKVSGIDIISTITLGTALGLFLGKQIGIYSAAWILIKTKIVKMPEKASFMQIYAASIFCGIGFTMSIFVAVLSFHDGTSLTQAKIGVLCGSLLSFCYGTLILHFASRAR